MPLPQCCMLTARQTPCSNTGYDDFHGHHVCGIHGNSLRRRDLQGAPYTEGRCLHFGARWCDQNAVEGRAYCDTHLNVVPRPRRVAPPKPVLQRLAADPQNVHTGVVSEQTNKNMKTLLDLSATLPHQNLRLAEWFLREWVTNSYSKGWQTTREVVDDMERWFSTTTCRNTDDNLYRNVLCGLYVYVKDIKDTERRSQMMKRVFEECQESVGMCCEGHLSRLCNVLVGFDDRFETPVSLGEKIQNEMAKISMKEAETDAKVKEANAFFDEHKVPEGDRTAWLEAF